MRHHLFDLCASIVPTYTAIFIAPCADRQDMRPVMSGGSATSPRRAVAGQSCFGPWMK